MLTKRCRRASPPLSTLRRCPGAGDAGQTALMLVMGLVLILTTGAGVLAANALDHDPLIQGDLLQHFSYRALEAGVDTFLSDVNADPNLVNCNQYSPAGGECTPSDYEVWEPVGATGNSTTIPEFYSWGDPKVCFNAQCTATTYSATNPDLFVQVEIGGAAGVYGHMSYQYSTVNLTPANGFLSRIWWSNYEASDPALDGGTENLAGTSPCTWDWNNSYDGPDVTGSYCSAVYYGPGDKIYGPIFSNDSIYVSSDPSLGSVTTADPDCLFVTGTGGAADCLTAPTVTSGQTTTTYVTETGASTSYQYGAAKEPIPTEDNSLLQWAQLDGCVYQGPTTIHFNAPASGAAATMYVWSPDSTSSSTRSACMPSGQDPPAGGAVTVPNGSAGNGVIYVNNAPSGSCVAGANPYDDWTSGANGAQAQWGTADGTYYNYFGWAGGNPDCEGDAFVGDSPSGTSAGESSTGGGISGQLTVAADNDVIVTNNLEYDDCGSSFNFTTPSPTPGATGSCAYNTSGTNDALGLVANQYVEVNHPVVPNCTTTQTTKNGKTTTTTTCTAVTSSTCTKTGVADCLEAACPTYSATATTPALNNPYAALCDPDTGSGVVIDGAVLALNGAFGVNNEGIDGSNGFFGVGAAEAGTLTVYGSIDQDWRGVVGEYSGTSTTSGYTKYYDWDWRLQAVTPPYYLSPGTQSWVQASSGASVSSTPQDGFPNAP